MNEAVEVSWHFSVRCIDKVQALNYCRLYAGAPGGVHWSSEPRIGSPSKLATCLKADPP